jgi:hypothetical protein
VTNFSEETTPCSKHGSVRIETCENPAVWKIAQEALLGEQAHFKSAADDEMLLWTGRWTISVPAPGLAERLY